MDSHASVYWSDQAELAALGDLPDPPKVLYYRGSWDATLFADAVAVVGSRRMTTYGRQVIEQLIPHLVSAGKTIVSGFMYGVDQYAHEMCLHAGGKTIAILGWGIDVEMESSDKKLADAIICNGGLILSEWQTQKGALWTFPVRNRIVAALSREVYVIEAAPKSGSLLTAKIASKLHRTLWAVPGPITSRTSIGTNTLIAEGKARLWQPGASTVPSARSDDPLLVLLAAEPLSGNAIAKRLGKPIAEIGAQLSLLSLTGQIKEHDGVYSKG